MVSWATVVTITYLRLNIHEPTFSLCFQQQELEFTLLINILVFIIVP